MGDYLDIREMIGKTVYGRDIAVLDYLPDGTILRDVGSGLPVWRENSEWQRPSRTVAVYRAGHVVSLDGAARFDVLWAPQLAEGDIVPDLDAFRALPVAAAVRDSRGMIAQSFHVADPDLLASESPTRWSVTGYHGDVEDPAEAWSQLVQPARVLLLPA